MSKASSSAGTGSRSDHSKNRSPSPTKKELQPSNVQQPQSPRPPVVAWTAPGSAKKDQDDEKKPLIVMAQKGEWGAIELALKYASKEFLHNQYKDPVTNETVLMLAARDNRIVIIERLCELGVNVNDRTTDKRCALHYAASNSRDEAVKALLLKKAETLHAGGPDAQLPLHIAASRVAGGYTIAQMLLKSMPKEGRLMKDALGNLPITYAIETGSLPLVKELLTVFAAEQVKWQSRDNKGDYLIHIAARKSDVEIVKCLVTTGGADVNVVNNDGQTALHIASRIGADLVVRALYTLKADCDIGDKKHRTPLLLAAEHGRTTILEMLAERFKANVQMRTKDGSTLMHLASERGHADTVLAFIKRGVPLFMPNKSGTLCLHVAAQNGHVKVVKTLIQKGTPVDAQTKDGYTALHLSVLQNRPDIIQTLLGYGAEVDLKGGAAMETPLHIAARLPDGLRSAEMLLKSGASVNETTEETGESPLHITARNGFLDLLKMLLAEGADATQTSKQGETALHLAVRHCHFDIAKALITFVKENRSAREAANLVNVANVEGETCLHLAAELGKSQTHFPFEDVDMIRLLLENGADNLAITKLTLEIPLHYCARAGNSEILQEIVWQMGPSFQTACNRQAKNGWSPLMTACDQGHATVAEILLQNNARVDVFDEHGKAALHLAAENGHVECCEVLLTFKAFINAKSKLGITPLHLAAQNGFVDLIKLLIEKYKAAMDANSLAKKTPLHLAAEAGRKEVCQLLLNLRADANATDALGQTPLHLAAENDHSDVVKLFMKYKPELVTTASKSGMTCAHIAANKGSVAVIRELMRFNKSAVTSARNKTNDSLPIHLAASGGHKEVVKVLLETGASAVDENAEGMTAIHLAAKEGFVEVFDVISSKTLLKTASLKNGLSPIHVAAFFGKAEVVRELLLQVSASLKTEAPQYAAGMSDKALKELISNDFGLTCLHLASFSGHENVVRLLLNIPGVMTDEQTAVLNVCPMHYAAANGHLTIISLLLSKSTEHLHLEDKRGRTPLHLAAENGHADMVSMLLGQGSDINGLDKNNWTPLMYAAKAGHLNVVKLLVDSGASTSKKTIDGKTALALSASALHTEVLSYLLSKDHQTWELVDDHGFVFDLMLCGKINKNQSIEELVMHSKAPLDTAAKLAKLYRVLALKEKERARDLNETGKHCEHMATELLGIAANITAPSTVLRAIDSRGRQFLDSLLEDDLKEVVSNAAVQRYLSDIWTGSLSSWSMARMFFLFMSFLCCPIVWAVFTLPLPHKYHKIPIVKFMGLLVSHVYFLTIITFVAVIPLHPIVDREHMEPDWLELLLLLWVSGMMVAELTNNSAGRTGLGLLRPVIVVICVFAAFIHTVILLIDFVFDDHDTVVLLMYVRNQFLSLAIFSGIVLIVEFLTFHYLFGPFAIIISTLMSDVIIFLVVLFLFIAGFALQVSCVYSPLRDVLEPSGVYGIKSTMEPPFEEFSGNFSSPPQTRYRRALEEEQLTEAQSVFLSYITHHHDGTRIRRSVDDEEDNSTVLAPDLGFGIAGEEDGITKIDRFIYTEDEIAQLDLRYLGDAWMKTKLDTNETLIRIYKCPAPGPKLHGRIEYEPVDSYSNEDGTTVIKLFTIFFFALYGIGNPNVLPKVERGPYWGQHITKISYGIYMLLCIVVLINLLVAMLVETYKAIHNKSDSEWKFGRAKLIRDMIKMSPTPTPLNVFVRPVLYMRSLKRHGRLMFTVYAQYYLNLDEHAGDDEILDTQPLTAQPATQAKRSFGQRILRFLLCRCFKKDELRGDDTATLALQAAQQEHNGPQAMETAIDWATVARKYHIMKAEEAEHEGHQKAKHGKPAGKEEGGEHGAAAGEQGAAGGDVAKKHEGEASGGTAGTGEGHH